MNKISNSVQDFVKMQILEVLKDNPFITKKELAEKVGVSERTIYRLIDKYSIKLIKEKMSMERKCVKYLKSIGYTFK